MLEGQPPATTSSAQLNTAELERPKQRILGHKLKTIFDQIRFIKKYFVYVIIFENKMNILNDLKGLFYRNIIILVNLLR